MSPGLRRAVAVIGLAGSSCTWMSAPPPGRERSQPAVACDLPSVALLTDVAAGLTGLVGAVGFSGYTIARGGCDSGEHNPGGYKPDCEPVVLFIGAGAVVAAVAITSFVVGMRRARRCRDAGEAHEAWLASQVTATTRAPSPARPAPATVDAAPIDAGPPDAAPPPSLDASVAPPSLDASVPPP